MEEKIRRFGNLCKKKLLTQQEHREFKRLEKSITSAMSDETVFNAHIDSFKQAIAPLTK